MALDTPSPTTPDNISVKGRHFIGALPANTQIPSRWSEQMVLVPHTVVEEDKLLTGAHK